jgi:diaminohydroxyphosphoribosylaminopyrimidine deaminase/5-amino-6-(5-phosphoribosylamino)uracil reductase
MSAPFDTACMQRALELAARGQGYVEPNPMVGCVIARNGEIITEGWHQKFGGPHAEIEALKSPRIWESQAPVTFYVTLEPCCHHGKTPPCTNAIIAAKPARVVVAMSDPFPKVAGGGIAKLQAAGIPVEVGLLESQARELNAPYLMLVENGRPWTVAKWAMTLDGKLATASGDSQWISNEGSRAIVHQLRGRVDAIVVGRGTALADNPQLTVRPPGARTPVRVVLDSAAQLPLGSHLVQTAREAPVLVAVGPLAALDKIKELEAAGCEVHHDAAPDPLDRLVNLWQEFGQRRMTNVLVEGGAQLFGTLFGAQLVDEVHAFIAPKIAGGSAALSPVGGAGVQNMLSALSLKDPQIETIAGDVYVRGRLRDRGVGESFAGKG